MLKVGLRIRMDEKDVRIFCEMGFKYLDHTSFVERHVSPTEIGRKLGLDEKTVRLRVKKMEDEGFIKYYQTIPNLALFGKKWMGIYTFEAPDIPSKQGAIRFLQSSPWVLDITDWMGPIFATTLAGPSPEQVQSAVDEVTDELKLKSSFKIADRRSREPAMEPNKLDWQIMQRLRYDALCPTSDIAGELSVTYKMVDYRISKLLESAVFLVRAIINAQRQQGIIFYALLLFVDETRKETIIKELQEKEGARVWQIFSPMPGILSVNMFGFTPGEPEEALTKTLRLEGIKQGFLGVFKEMIEAQRPNWIDKLIEKQIVLV